MLHIRTQSALLFTAPLILFWSCASETRTPSDELYAYYTRQSHYTIPVGAGFRAKGQEPLVLHDETVTTGFVVKIGHTAEDFAGRFSGTIDEVLIYTRALNAEEIETLVCGSPPEKDLVARYPFDGSFEDASGLSGSAELAGDADYAEEAKQGSHALELNGETGVVLTPVTGVLENFTWAAWIRTTEDGTVVANCNETGRWHEGGQTMFLREGRLVFDVGWVGDTAGGSKLTDGRWHHVAVTADRSDGADVRLYVDGKPAGRQGRRRNQGEITRAITGRYADIIVSIFPEGQVIFSRETSYLPQWKTAAGTSIFKEIIPRKPDPLCLYSYARIIESTPEKVLVHWCYAPDPAAIGSMGTAHEYFEIRPDGHVRRTIRQATEKLDQWNDPANVTVQKLGLAPQGVIEEITLQPAALSKRPGEATEGSPVTREVIGAPVASWSFDEGLEERPYEKKYLTIESVSGNACPVEGNAVLWKKGVSGTALAFDGYDSTVRLKADQAPAGTISTRGGELPHRFDTLVRFSFHSMPSFSALARVVSSIRREPASGLLSSDVRAMRPKFRDARPVFMLTRLSSISRSAMKPRASFVRGESMRNRAYAGSSAIQST